MAAAMNPSFAVVHRKGPVAYVNDCATHLFRRLESFSRRRLLTSVMVGVLAMSVRLAFLPRIPFPEPVFHDEFSYLLAADTFRSGRLTNPTPSLWIHFETFHELFQPTYMSKYPPGQGLFLALGWKLLGHPWYGVWISFGCFYGALCWMLQGWMPPVYALLTSILMLGQITVFSPWMNSYWGGAVTAFGGCLLLGALPRLARRPTATLALIAAFSLLLLANSRPYEGLVLSVAVLAVLVRWRSKRALGFAEFRSLRILGPFLVVLGLGAMWMGYYNYRVTGNPFLIPYTLYTRTYAVAPSWIILPEQKPPLYHHEILRKYWTETNPVYYREGRVTPVRIHRFLHDVLPLFASVPLLLLAAAGLLNRSIKTRVVVAISAWLLSWFVLETYYLPHYLAEGAGLVPILGGYGLRVARFRSGRFGAAVALLIVMIIGLQKGINHTAQFIASHLTAGGSVLAAPPSGMYPSRTQIAALVLRQGGRHLILVRYTPEHGADYDFVFNGADIDASAVIWARDMGSGANRELIDHYPDRKVWLWQPDISPGTVTPIPR
jgi:hypothetical protein